MVCFSMLLKLPMTWYRQDPVFDIKNITSVSVVLPNLQTSERESPMPTMWSKM